MAPPNPTAMKLFGLLVALGLFSVGPASILAEELKRFQEKRDGSKYEKPENIQETSEASPTINRRLSSTRPNIEAFVHHPFDRAVQFNHDHQKVFHEERHI